MIQMNRMSKIYLPYHREHVHCKFHQDVYINRKYINMAISYQINSYYCLREKEHNFYDLFTYKFCQSGYSHLLHWLELYKGILRYQL